jgi:hypothetical protein
VVLQHLGLADADLDALGPVLDAVGAELGVQLQLHSHAGDVVLLDQPFSAQLSPQLVLACAEGRPVVVLDSQYHNASVPLRLERWRLSLLQQLGGTAPVRARSARAGAAAWAAAPQPRPETSAQPTNGTVSTGFDTEFDTQLHSEQLLASDLEHARQELLKQVLRGASRPEQQPLVASYGEGAHLLFDFRARLVFIDPLAQQHLRVRRELPLPAPGMQPNGDALVRELDETLWDLGIAAGPHALLDEPADWWGCPLRWVADSGVERYSRIPRHLDLARRLRQGPATPSTLRSHARVSIGDLRRFIQACLMAQLLQWAPEIQEPSTGAH